MNPIKSLSTIAKNFLGRGVNAFAWEWSAPGKISNKELLSQFTRYVYPIVSAIAQDTAKIELEIYKLQGDERKLQPQHELLKLMRRPNPDYSQFQFLELHQIYLQLTGESFWFTAPKKFTRKPTAFYLIRPDLMDVVVESGGYGHVIGYVMKKSNGEKVPFDKDEILHFKLPNPKDPYRGMGVIEAAADYIQTEKYATDWTKNIFYNSGRPSGVLNIKSRIDEKEFERVKRRFNSEYAGITNAGKTMLINSEQGVDYSKMGMDLGDVALKEIKDMTRDDLMVMWRVSKTILGITDDVNRASSLEAQKVWIGRVINPANDRFTDHLTAMLMPLFDKTGDLIVSYRDQMPEDPEAKVAEWKAGHNRWLTTNDIRRERGLSEIDGGDVLGKPIDNGDNDNEDEPNDSSDTEDKSVKKKETPKDNLTRLERGEVFRKELFERQENWEKLVKQKVKKAFLMQQTQILSTKKKDLVQWVFDKQEANTIFLELLTPTMIDMYKQQGQSALDFFADELGESELLFDVSQRVQSHIKERITRMAEGTNQETLDKLTESITEGINAGETISKLRKRVQDIYEDATTVRAERIARTETISASNAAANMAYQQSPAVIAKEWVVEPGHCEFCAAMAGKVVGLSENYALIGQDIESAQGNLLKIDYADVTHPPLHPNCRCSIIPVTNSGIV